MSLSIVICSPLLQFITLVLSSTYTTKSIPLLVCILQWTDLPTRCEPCFVVVLLIVCTSFAISAAMLHTKYNCDDPNSRVCDECRRMFIVLIMVGFSFLGNSSSHKTDSFMGIPLYNHIEPLSLSVTYLLGTFIVHYAIPEAFTFVILLMLLADGTLDIQGVYLCLSIMGCTLALRERWTDKMVLKREWAQDDLYRYSIL